MPSVIDIIAHSLGRNKMIKIVLSPIYSFYKQSRLNFKKIQMKFRFSRYGKEALLAFDRCMTENGYHYTLMAGSLLGAIRDKGFIKHDLDIDTAMWYSDFDDNLYFALEQYGFHRKYSYSIENDSLGKEDSFVYKGISVDIFYFYPPIDEFPYLCDFIAFPEYKGIYGYEGCAQEFGGLLPRRVQLPYSKNIIRVPFESVMMPVPDNANELLEYRYGHDYMIPNPKWTMHEKNKIITEWPEKLGIFKTFSK